MAFTHKQTVRTKKKKKGKSQKTNELKKINCASICRNKWTKVQQFDGLEHFRFERKSKSLKKEGNVPEAAAILLQQ